jgi:uncharacterized membrane protein
MLTNSAIAAVLVYMVALFWLMGETTFLAPYRKLIVLHYGWIVLVFAVLVYVNLVAVFYLVARLLFLRDAGQRLEHVDKQLAGPDTIARELSEQLREHGLK